MRKKKSSRTKWPPGFGKISRLLRGGGDYSGGRSPTARGGGDYSGGRSPRGGAALPASFGGAGGEELTLLNPTTTSDRVSDSDGNARDGNLGESKIWNYKNLG